MKTKNFLLSGIVGIALAGIILTGCHKDSTPTPPSSSTTSSDITAAQDESNASDAMNDSKNISDAAANGNSSEYRPSKNVGAIYSAHCTVTWARDTNGYDTMYINFGATPVECNDHRWRKGEIIVYWARIQSKSLLQIYFDSSSTINMTFNNYAVGNSDTGMIGVSGSRVWQNTGANLLSQQNWNFTASLMLTYPNNQTATWNSTRTNSLVNKGGVYYYEISGSAYGRDRNNVNYTVSITNPLYVTALPWWLGGCAWIESGTIAIVANNTILVNFGTLGVCTPVKTATINNHTYYFVM